MTQTSQLLEYLLNHPEGITPLEALEKFGCFRLGARIHDIRNGNTPSGKAYPVETVNETKGGKTYARYMIPVLVAGGVPKDHHSDCMIMYGPQIPSINLLPEMRLL